MLLSYLRIALRNLVKHKVYTVVNVAGLSVGIACCLFIFLFVHNEMGYDAFFANGDRIYRVRRVGEMNGEKIGIPYVSPPYAPALRNDFPDEIVHAVRVMPERGLVTYGDKSFQENKLFFTDSTFFEVFSYPLRQGDPRTVLDKPNSLVITPAVARKYFGDADPVGKVLDIDNGTYRYEVTGVMAPPPGNAHLDFDFLASTGPFAKKDWLESWRANAMVTYVLLAENASVPRLEAQFPAFMDKYMSDYFKQRGRRTDLTLQPLSDIYFGKHIDIDPALHGDLQVIYLFSTVALFILAIACINFMNLSRPVRPGRAKEVGMRKVMGAFRTDLDCAVPGRIDAAYPAGRGPGPGAGVRGPAPFSAFLEKPLALPLSSPAFWAFLVVLTLVVGALAGTYPAFFLSAFQPIRVLKGKFTTGRGSAWLRKSLVVVQFSISVLLIVGTFIIVRQLDYVRAKNLGYDKAAHSARAAQQPRNPVQPAGLRG
jgi:putative ABC transport system permease protein